MVTRVCRLIMEQRKLYNRVRVPIPRPTRWRNCQSTSAGTECLSMNESLAFADHLLQEQQQEGLYKCLEETDASRDMHQLEATTTLQGTE